MYRPRLDGLPLAACRENPEAYPADKPSEVPWMSEWLKSDRLLGESDAMAPGDFHGASHVRSAGTAEFLCSLGTERLEA